MVDPTNIGETSVNALSRVLGTSSLPASTIDRVRARFFLVVI
jgi:sorting nexin-8